MLLCALRQDRQERISQQCFSRDQEAFRSLKSAIEPASKFVWSVLEPAQVVFLWIAAFRSDGYIPLGIAKLGKIRLGKRTF